MSIRRLFTSFILILSFSIHSPAVFSQSSGAIVDDPSNTDENTETEVNKPSSCKKATAVQKDGYLVWDQTEVKDKNMLINHLISAGLGIWAVKKLITVKCKPVWTPSFLIFNGVSAVGLFQTVMNIINNKKASKELLEASLNVSDKELQAQVDLYKKAAEQTRKAYKAAKNRVKIAKLVKTAKMVSIAAAGVEMAVNATPYAPPGRFMCLDKGSWEAVDLSNPEQISSMLSENSFRISGDGILGKATGFLQAFLNEKTPGSRLISYGASFIIFDVLINKTNDESECLKERAEEYDAFATALQNRYGKDGNVTETTIAQNTKTDLSPTAEVFTRDDFPGCIENSGGNIGFDRNCDCDSKRKNCFNISANPKPYEVSGNISGTSPFSNSNSVTRSIAGAQNVVNGIASGNASQANLGASTIGSNAFKLRKGFEKAKEDFNKKRVAEGKKPIDFEKESRKLYEKIRSAAGRALDENNINTLSDLDNLILKEGLIPDAEKYIDKNEVSPKNNSPATIASISNKKTINGLDENFDFLDNSTTSSNNPKSNTEKDIQENLKNLKINDGGISSESSKNIFNIITRRYLESGYPKLLELKSKTSPEELE